MDGSVNPTNRTQSPDGLSGGCFFAAKLVRAEAERNCRRTIREVHRHDSIVLKFTPPGIGDLADKQQAAVTSIANR